MSLKIGNLVFDHGIMLAPMAGYTDRAFRVVASRLGAELSVTEMVSAKACVYGDRKTKKLAKIMPDEGRVALQIFGSEPDTMARAAEILSLPIEDGVAPTLIDINMGCPVNKIFSNGEGSALMRDPDLIYRIVKATVGTTDLPVSAKLRLGVDNSTINVCECAAAVESAGGSMVTIHGRTRVDMYSGSVNLDEIKKVKNSLHIPVVANGDIRDGDSALHTLSYTGADGIAIGRGAVGNPFIFSEVYARLSGEEYAPPTFEARREMALLQLSIAILDKGEAVAVREARKQVASYLVGFSGAARLRAEINMAFTYDEVRRILESAEAELMQ